MRDDIYLISNNTKEALYRTFYVNTVVVFGASRKSLEDEIVQTRTRFCNTLHPSHPKYQKPSPPGRIINLIIRVPYILDKLDCRALCSLARVNKDLRQIVDQPETWKNCFSREVGADPANLPPPPRHLTQRSQRSTTPFKAMCRGLTTLQFAAEHSATPIGQNSYDEILLTTIEQYLDDYAPEVRKNFNNSIYKAVQDYTQNCNNYKNDVVISGTATVTIGILSATCIYTATQVEAALIAVKTANIALLLATFGPVGARIYIYTLIGVTSFTTIGMTTLMGCMTYEIIQQLINEHKRHKENMRHERTQMKIDAGRAFNCRTMTQGTA